MGIKIGNIDIKIPIVQSGVDINEYMSDTIPNGKKYDSVILKFRNPLKMEGPSASGAFSGFGGTEIPLLETSNVTNMQEMFKNCPSLVTIPLFDTSNVTNMYMMFYYCKSLITIPELDTSNVTNMAYMFNDCEALTSIPELDTSNVTNMEHTFVGCSSLTEIPQLNTSNVTTMWGTFRECSSLKTIPQLDTSKVTNMNYMFERDYIIEIPELDASNVNSIVMMFSVCRELTTFGGLKNLGKAYDTTKSSNYSNYKLDLSYSTKLTHDSLMNVINNLYDIATKGCNPQQLKLGSENLSKLTQEEIAIATNKGWNVIA